MSLLRVAGLSVTFPTPHAEITILDSLDFALDRGEFVGMVGESGAGKTMSALAILGLLPSPGRVSAGSIIFDGTELTRAREEQLRRIRGARIGMIFQEPMAALNPIFTIGFQITEAIRVHQPLLREEARREALRLLDLVAMPEASRCLHDYPHQLSGGQRQRAMIAMALACGPDLLLADEPTTALDVTIQAQILDLLESLRQELSLGVLLITHDLAVVAETCDRVLVLYSGRLVEEAPAERLFRRPAHPYTEGLLAALPRLGGGLARGALRTIPGQVPDPATRPSGCSFHPRCGRAIEECATVVPELYDLQDQHRARCLLHRPTEAG